MIPDSIRRSGIDVLSARLGRLACEADQTIQEIIARPVTERDELLLAAPIAHIALTLDNITDAVYRSEKLDQRSADQDRVAA